MLGSIPERTKWLLAWALVLGAYLVGMFLDVQEIDATQYACMGREMLETGHFLQLFDGPKPYLDKPPLTFWCTALSYFLFGVSNFSFRLPSVLFSLWAAYSTFRLGELLHGKRSGMYAALVLASCQAFFLMNNDVKTDMYLLGPMMFASWKMVAVARGEKGYHVIFAAIGVGLSMLAKGPIGLVAPVAVAGADLLWRRDWKNLFRPAWLLGIPVLALVLLPFTWGQYQQYGTEGVLFFYWTQSFGRITGESEWANDATAFFFVHTFAWAYLPWTAMFLVALFVKFRQIIRFPSKAEVAALFGFVFLFLALSLSRYKLPHYIFIVTPFASILVVEALTSFGRPDVLFSIQKGVILLLLLAAAFLTFWPFPEAPLLPKLLCSVLLIASCYFTFKERDPFLGIFLSGAMAMSAINLMLNWVLFPSLLSYQSTASAGKFVRDKEIPKEKVFAYRVSGRAFNFYHGAVVNPIPTLTAADTVANSGTVWIYTDSAGLSELESRNSLDLNIAARLPHYRVNRITLPFLNPAIRPTVVSTRFLLEVKGNPAHPRAETPAE